MQFAPNPSDLPVRRSSSFLSRLDGAKQRLFPTGGNVDNYHLFTNLLDLLDGGSSGAAVQQEESASPSTLVQTTLDSHT